MHTLKNLANRAVFVPELNKEVEKGAIFEVELTDSLRKRIKDKVFEDLGEPLVKKAMEEQEAIKERPSEEEPKMKSRAAVESMHYLDEEFVDQEFESTKGKKRKR